MRPALSPGDGLLALRGGALDAASCGCFAIPTLSTRWLVKRVGDVRGAGRGAIFEARSDNPGAPGAVDSRQFGWVPAAGSYRVVWTVRRQSRPLALVSSCAPGIAGLMLSGSTQWSVGAGRPVRTRGRGGEMETGSGRAIEIAPFHSRGSLKGFVVSGRWPDSTKEWAQVLQSRRAGCIASWIALHHNDFRCP